MAGKLYKNSVRLSRAYAEGSRGVPATNPHPAGSPANLAFAEGAKHVCATYGGVAECAHMSIMPVVLGTGASSGGAVTIPAPAPAPEPRPTDEWVKADIVVWLLERGCTEPEATLKGMLKADLLTMAESF